MPAAATTGKPLIEPGLNGRESFWLAHLVYWLDSVPQRAVLFEQEGITPNDEWETIFQKNSSESRARVQRIVERLKAEDIVALEPLLEMYEFVPTLRSAKTGIIVEYLPKSDQSLPIDEVNAVFGLLNLAAAGKLNKIETCPMCGQLFVLSRGGQKNCSTSCSKEADRRRPEVRQRRAQAQLVRYDELFPEVRRKRKPR